MTVQSSYTSVPTLSCGPLPLLWFVSQLRNSDMLWTAKAHTIFTFPWVLPNVLFWFQDPIQDTTLHSVNMSPCLLLLMTISHFPCFWWPGQFCSETQWPRFIVNTCLLSWNSLVCQILDMVCQRFLLSLHRCQSLVDLVVLDYLSVFILRFMGIHFTQFHCKYFPWVFFFCY